MERKSLVPTFYMASTASINKVWDRYKEISMAESSQVGGIDIEGDVLRETAKKIEKIQDIQKMITEALEGNKIHKISRLLEIILAGAIAIKPPIFTSSRKKSVGACACASMAFCKI
jgi:hypothetical protein